MQQQQYSEEEVAIIKQYQSLYNQYVQLQNKIDEIESEHYEHGIVIEAISKLEKERKCHRLVGGVLVERTVGEILPALQKSQTDFKQAIDQLDKESKKREGELTEFKLKYNIKVRGETNKEEEEKKSRQGVLA
eukprot:gene331-6745_t